MLLTNCNWCKRDISSRSDKNCSCRICMICRQHEQKNMGLELGFKLFACDYCYNKFRSHKIPIVPVVINF